MRCDKNPEPTSQQIAEEAEVSVRERYVQDLIEQGFAVVEKALALETVGLLISALGDSRFPEGQGKAVYARRNLLRDVPEIRSLADSAPVRNLVEPILGEKAFPVRALLFDKLPEANWKVPWHQDLSIAVKERRDVPGFGPWSEKAGVTHVQASPSVLERMLSVRLHLDPCGEENGPLRVLPGSHRHGKRSAGEIEVQRKAIREVSCPVEIGGALLLRPLLLHASSPSQSPAHRRVIHIEFAAEPLPGGLQWFEAP
jgi:hypothetical protein